MPAAALTERYRLLDAVGRSWSGVVYRALDVAKDEVVALKHFALGAQPSLERRTRFRHELELLAQAGGHPALVRVRDVGEDEGCPFVVMDFIAGARSLPAPPPEGLPVEDALALGGQVARALAHAHQSGVTHKALMLESLLVSPAAPLLPRLTGFGLACLEDLSQLFDAPPVEGEADPTRRFWYLAPEQAGLLRRPVGAAADLYALGVLLHHLLAGAPPFPGDDPGAVLHGHLARPAPPLRERRPDAPPALAELVERLLAKEPDGRPASADEVVRALGALAGARAPAPAPTVVDVRTMRRDAPLVARGPHLAALGQVVARAAQGDGGGVVLLGGDAGLGKSRLIEAVAALARDVGGQLVLGKCAERTRPRPLAPFVEALEDYQARTWGMPQAKRQAVLERLQRCPQTLSPGMAQVGPTTSYLPGGDGPRADHFARCVTFLSEAAGALEPVLVIAIDDLQWADEGTLELFVRLAASPQKNLVLIGAFRPTELERLAREALDRVRAHEPAPLDVALEPLGPDDADALIMALLADEGASAREVARAVREVIGGNPLHLAEAMKGLADLGALSAVDGGWRLEAARLADAALRAGVTDVVRARAERLGEVAYRTLSRAAVIGRRFGFDLLVDLSGLRPSQALLALEQGRAAGLIVEDPTRERVAWNFAHDKVREALYDAVPEDDLRALHAKIGDAIRQDEPGDLGNVAAELAYHYTRADDRGRAVEFHLLAGERAAAAFVLRDAAQHFRAALDLLDPVAEPARFARTVAGYAAARRYAGDYLELVPLLDRALEIAERLGDPLLEVEITGRQAMVAELSSSPDAEAWIRRFVARAEAVGDGRGIAVGRAMLAYHHFDHGEPREAIFYVEQALAERELLEPIEALNLEGVLGYSRARTGHFDEGVARIRAALRTAEASGLRASQGWCWTTLGALHLEWNEWEEGLRCYERARPILEETGDVFYTSIARATYAISRFLSGDVDEGLRLLAEAMAWARARGVVAYQDAFTSFLGEALVQAGRRDEGILRMRAALEGARVRRDRWIGARARRALAEALALDPGSRAEAEQLARDGLASAEEVGLLPEVGRTLRVLADLLDHRGADAEAREARARAREVLSACQMTRELALLPAPAPPAASAAASSSLGPASRELVHRRGLKTIVAVSRMVGATLDLDALLDRALQAVTEVLGAERGLVLLDEPATSGGGAAGLTVRVAHGPGARALADAIAAAPEHPVGTLARRVHERGRAAEPGALPGVASLCVPVGAQAVLYLENRLVADLFAVDDVLVLEAIAAQLAAGIENARAYGEIARLKERLERENVYLKEELATTHAFEEIVGESPALRRSLRRLEQVAPLDTIVLLRGETGTGKELFARAVHEHSPRRDGPLVRVNCSGLTPSLVASELFGHERGAFTGATGRRLGRFELAAGGTIFLDEIGDVPLETQLTLLRVLCEREFERVGGTTTLRTDARVVAATNRDLEAAVRAGTFRADLLYRLNGFVIDIPPLRERKGDVPLLARHFALKHGRRLGKDVREVAPEALESLERYPWPGNVRELEHVVERAVVLSPGAELRLEDAPAASGATEASFDEGVLVTLAEQERRYIVSVLERTAWTIKGEGGAARILGVPPSTLTSRMKKLGIARPAAAGPGR
jgi:transcriptional regulator with GAF, ATPase, and Fis domain/tetratricopeptide (TPR) repeat protein